MRSSAGKIHLTGFEDLFQTNGEAQGDGERVQEIFLSELFPFKDHPFHVRNDEAMQETAASIAKHTIMNTLLSWLTKETPETATSPT